MSDEIAIKVENVSKSFKLPHEKQTSIKGALINLRNKKRGYESQHVLDDVSFEVKKGEFFGIVGRNGSGKSTLLKLLAGIYTPDKGGITVNGKLTPFIELGVGFNPELSGRENVFLNGALLGFNRQEMEAMYDDIVSFAELERFMDQKLKNYSSGMQVRLAFSIAIRANGDILLLDEVLAVGDEAFQRKCFSYFETLKKNKQTVVLVTHDMASVQRFCNRAMLIQDGKIIMVGDTQKATAEYSRINTQNFLKSKDRGLHSQKKLPKSKIDIQIKDLSGKKTNDFMTGDTMVVTLSWPQPSVRHTGVAIVKKTGEYIFGPNTFLDGKECLDGNSQRMTYRVVLPLAEGEYYLKAGVFGDNDKIQIDYEDAGPEFTVSIDPEKPRWGGSFYLDHEWEG